MYRHPLTTAPVRSLRPAACARRKKGAALSAGPLLSVLLLLETLLLLAAGRPRRVHVHGIRSVVLPAGRVAHGFAAVVRAAGLRPQRNEDTGERARRDPLVVAREVGAGVRRGLDAERPAQALLSAETEGSVLWEADPESRPRAPRSPGGPRRRRPCRADWGGGDELLVVVRLGPDALPHQAPPAGAATTRPGRRRKAGQRSRGGRAAAARIHGRAR